jgi:hypothetical protein
MVRRHFHFKAKWRETEANFFRFHAKRGNLKWNENETKQKQNEKEAKTAIIILFETKWSETEVNFFRFDAKKVFFLHLNRNENEMKQKQNEKEAKTIKRKRIKSNSGTTWSFSFSGLYLLKWKEAKKRLFHFASKRNKAKIVYFVSLWSETKKSEAKRSEKKNFRKRNNAKIRCNNFA